jgi:hypothetical protein
MSFKFWCDVCSKERSVWNKEGFICCMKCGTLLGDWLRDLDRVSGAFNRSSPPLMGRRVDETKISDT